MARHPYQILELNELIVGERYAFVYIFSNPQINLLTFGGILASEKDNSSIIKNPPMSVLSDNVVTAHLVCDGVERKIGTNNESAADWEKRMRAKKNDAMRKMLGY